MLCGRLQEYFFDSQLPNFVEKCLTSKFRDRDMVEPVQVFLQDVVKVRCGGGVWWFIRVVAQRRQRQVRVHSSMCSLRVCVGVCCDIVRDGADDCRNDGVIAAPTRTVVHHPEPTVLGRPLCKLFLHQLRPREQVPRAGRGRSFREGGGPEERRRLHVVVHHDILWVFKLWVCPPPFEAVPFGRDQRVCGCWRLQRVVGAFAERHKCRYHRHLAGNAAGYHGVVLGASRCVCCGVMSKQAACAMPPLLLVCSS